MDELKKLLSTRFSDMSERIKNKSAFKQIWRGVWGDEKQDYFLINPSAGERASANTSNEYTTIFSYAKAWSKYPKRNQGLICADSLLVAGYYGEHQYLVIPENNAKIGICSGSDLWHSFHTTWEELGDDDNEMPTLNDIIRNGMKVLRGTKYMESGIGPLKQAFEETKKAMMKFPDVERFNEFMEENGGYNTDWHDPEASNLFRYIYERCKSGYTFIDAVGEIFSPGKNGFKLQNPKTFAPESRNDHEVWTDAHCIMIRNGAGIISQLYPGLVKEPMDEPEGEEDE